MKKHRTTKQKKIILEELKKIYTHPNATEIYEIVKKRLPEISISTIYRNLNRLVRTGEILRIDTGSAPARYDGHTQHHYHIRCIRCGKIDDMDIEDNINISEKKLYNKYKYKIIKINIEFLGICPKCQEHNSDKKTTKKYI